MHKPLNRKGFTVLEVTAGLAVAGVLALVAAGLFRAGLKSYFYSVRQTGAVLAACRSFSGYGAQNGVIWSAQGATGVTTLSASSVTLVQADSTTVAFAAQNGGFYRAAGAYTTRLAEGVDTAAISYYSLDSNGRVIVATSAATAVLVSAQVSAQGTSPNEKPYTFTAAARLYNK